MKCIIGLLLAIVFFGIIIGGSFLFEKPKQSPNSVSQPTQTLIVTIDPQRLLALREQGVPVATTVRQFTETKLIQEADYRGIKITVSGIGDICRDDQNRLYRNVIISIPEEYVAFHAIQQLILIDFVTYVGNKEHHAAKHGCILEIK